MTRGTKVLTGTVLVAGAAVAAYYVVTGLQAKKARADEAVDSIQAELDSLDPVTKAAVVAKLSSNAARSRNAST